ncbi:MAG: LLM class flavin-dependent oxidoreductase [Nocardioidaceae bacterium]
MGDYGHPLLFGSFVTPRNDRPAEVVQLAVLPEAVGLDLVTVQDHPYQASYLDTWTLLSFLAARTSTVHLAANVTNLPLRPPAVLARSLASLDLLSGGRIELGLGAGAFWDAIVAMGGRRLTPGEGVQAVEEAVTIIRQLWDTDTRGGVRADAALRPRRPGRRGVGERRGRALRHQRDGHAAEQVDRGHVLRVLLPDRDDPSQPGGRSHVPRAQARRPRLGAVVERLEQEHRVIHDVLDGVDRALVAFVSVPGGVDELRAAVDILSDTLLSHLAYEERELVEPLSRVALY